MLTSFRSVIVASMLLCFAGCNNENASSSENKDSANTTTVSEAKPFKLKVDSVTYTAGSVSMKGYVAYDENKDGTRPAVLVVHEWWGLSEYPKRRARELAELGYIAMAIDLYGNGKVAEDPGTAGKMAEAFYKDPTMAKSRFDAAMIKLQSYAQTDKNRMAAIGYCFGGTQVLNMALLGDDLKAVVSFHGGLQTVQPKKELLKSEILICHGGADSFVPPAQVDMFKKSMDSVGAKYSFKTYDGATHAFTNPEADEKAKKFKMPIAYNEAADKASWQDMKEFLNRVLK